MRNDNRTSAGSSSGPRTDAFTFVVHWAMVAALIVSLITGLRIAADYAESAAGGVARLIAGILPEGAVIEWHVWSSWALFFAALAYPIFLWRSKQAIRVKADRSVLDRIRTARRNGNLWSNISAWFAINVVLYQIAFALILLMGATGLMLYTNVTLGLSNDTIAMIHGGAAFAFLAYIAIHILAQVKAGAFWKIFKPRMAYVGAAAVAMFAAGGAVAAIYVIDRGDHRELHIAQVAQAPVLDGNPDDTAWREARAVAIRTERGANLPDGAVVVEVKAVHDGERAYFQFRWPDEQRSQKHTPLIKVEGGWKVMQSEFEINDEDDYYEDKFSVVLSRTPVIGAGTVHLGQNLISGPHRPTTRGLHYTTDGSYADMWHWKSVRTGGMEPAFMDDDHFGPPKPSKKPGKRYTAGYSQDPKESGGYTSNWTKLDDSKPLNETLVVPKFVPADPILLQRMGKVDVDPNKGDEGIWFLRKEEVVPYDPALDVYPVGTVLPSVVIEGPFVGDRGDVPAGAEWKDGYWTLEAARVFDTGSKYDVAFAKGDEAYLWVAVFNHNQTRHSQHLHPVKLVVE